MKKILVTGGSGFIGTNFISNLLEEDFSDCQLLNVDIKPPRKEDHMNFWKKTDICNYENLKEAILGFSPDFVIHLAARTDLNGKTLEDYNSNSLGVSNLIEVLNELKSLEKVIFASSMYVCKPGYSPINFEDYKPHTIYGESKVLTEKIIKSANLKFTWTIIRPTSIWGPWFGEPYKNFFDIVLSGKYFHMGSKACNKTYGYIDNTTYQIMSIVNAPIEKVNKKVFYIGDWPAYNISEWADEIAIYLGIKIPKISFIFFRLAAYCGDILNGIGFKFPMTSFRLKNMTTDNIHDLGLINEIAPNLPVTRKEGTKRTVEWIKSNKK